MSQIQPPQSDPVSTLQEPAEAGVRPVSPEAVAAEIAPPAAVADTPPAASALRKDRSKPTPGGFHWGTGRRKTAIARVRIRPGAGEFKINKREADQFFPREVDRRAIRAPLAATELLKKLDVFVNVSGGGSTGQAGAIMLGVARALYHYDRQYEQVLRDGGYLTRDSREVERKKYGRSGARRRFQFSKR